MICAFRYTVLLGNKTQLFLNLFKLAKNLKYNLQIYGKTVFKKKHQSSITRDIWAQMIFFIRGRFWQMQNSDKTLF